MMFRNSFPDMKVDILDENVMKSQAEKDKWRPLLMDV